MKNLLLPYAYDSKGNLVHIDSAHKGETYTCPSCGAELQLKLSRIPEGKKYHRTNHFAHKGTADNHFSESFLHKLFKNKTAEFIKNKIERGEKNFTFKWDCDKCYEHHDGNLLKKAVKVEEEYNLGRCIPDIALLDKDNKVVIVIEIVVTHEPEPYVLEYYEANKIACLQIKVQTFDDCNNIEDMLKEPDSVNLCPNSKCEKCGNIMSIKKMVLANIKCWNCNKEMKVAMVEAHRGMSYYGPAEFSNEELEIARKNGVNIENVYSNTMRKHYNANICKHCKKFVGENYLHNYFYSDTSVIDEQYECLNCKEHEKERLENEIRLAYELDSLNAETQFKKCPKCGAVLKVRKSRDNKHFWGCENYPNCKHTENIEKLS